MSVLGIGAIQRRFVSAFDYMLACVGRAVAAAGKLVTWFTGWQWPWKAVGHGSQMAQFGTDVVVFGTHVR